MEHTKPATKAKQLQLHTDAIKKLRDLAPYHEQGEFVSALIHKAHVMAEGDRIAQSLRTHADKLRTLADKLQNL